MSGGPSECPLPVINSALWLPGRHNALLISGEADPIS